MKIERSAGGVIVSRSKDVWYVLLMRDMNRSLTFPKGTIEINEEPPDAARREICEEVGVTDLKLLRHLTTIEYYYKRKGTIHKQVMYYLFLSKTRQRTVIQKEEGISDASWMPIPEAVRLIGYPETNRPVLLRASRWISRNADRLI